MISSNAAKRNYIAKFPNKDGIIEYTNADHKTWKFLINRQIKLVQSYASEAYLNGLKILNLPYDRIPQCHEISEGLMRTTGWSVEPVSAMVPEREFFHLLASKKFPAATFIRDWEERDYIEVPDIFHEYFGHCPLLTNPDYAGFAQYYGKLALEVSIEDICYLGRLYRFTLECGLIQSPGGLKVYGGALLSSKDEVVYCLESEVPVRKPFDLMEILCTPYRVDIMQPIYFFLQNSSELFQLTKTNLLSEIQMAKKLEAHPRYIAGPIDIT
jgi:phenylalanine-4-hydroxylase